MIASSVLAWAAKYEREVYYKRVCECVCVRVLGLCVPWRRERRAHSFGAEPSFVVRINPIQSFHLHAPHAPSYTLCVSGLCRSPTPLWPLFCSLSSTQYSNSQHEQPNYAILGLHVRFDCALSIVHRLVFGPAWRKIHSTRSDLVSSTQGLHGVGKKASPVQKPGWVLVAGWT